MSAQVEKRETVIIGGGLHYLHTLKSGLFLGVGGDAEHIAAYIAEPAAN